MAPALPPGADCAGCGGGLQSPLPAYCPGCGQSVPVRRVDWAFLGDELKQSVLQVEKGALFTLKQLFTRPGHFLRAYLAGRRVGHVKPLSLLLLTAAVALLLGEYLLKGDLIGQGFNDGLAAGAGSNAAAQATLARFNEAFATAQAWANRNLTLVTLALLPIEAAVFKLAFGRGRGLNYPEWLVITTFLTVQTFVLWSLIIVLQTVLPGARHLLVPVTIVLGSYTLMQLFDTLPRWQSVLRALWGFALFQLVVGFTMMLVALGVLYTFGTTR